MISQLRSFYYQTQKPIELPAPVVSVGNISMGGTGKTPLTMLLAQELTKKGIRVAVLSRGYGRKSSKPILLSPEDKALDVEDMGDEPLMLKLRIPSLALCIHADRARHARENWGKLGCPQLVLLDDGFQHWKIRRDLDIVLWSSHESLQAKAIPFGKLREGFSTLSRAEYLVVTGKCEETRKNEIRDRIALLKKRERKIFPWKRAPSLGSPELAFANYSFAGFFRFSDQSKMEISTESEVLLGSGIASPERFREMMEQLSYKRLAMLSFPDHHFLSSKDVRKFKDLMANEKKPILVTTEKDFAKWKNLLNGIPANYARVELSFEDHSFLPRLLSKVISLCST